MRFSIGAMSVGDILDRGLKVLLSRVGTFYAIFLLVLSPMIVLGALMPKLLEAASGLGPAALLLPFLVWLITVLILSPIGTAASTHVIAREFIGEPVGLGDAFSFAMTRFGKVLGTSLLTGLLIFVGLVMCVVPGVIFLFWWMFAAGGQIPVVEGKAGADAMRRSKQLGQGFRGRIAGIIVLVVLLNVLLQLGLGFVLEALLPSVEYVRTAFGLQPRIINFRNHAIQTVILQLLSILVQTYGAICLTLLYFDLRIRKEGFDLELAAREQLQGDARLES